MPPADIHERSPQPPRIRAARLYGQSDLRIDELPAPRRSGDEVLLRSRAVGICGSDLHYYQEGGIGSARIVEPLVLGHEFAAEVVDPGPFADKLPAGTLVAVDPARPCNVCEWCRRGHRNLCPHVEFAGAPPYPGGLRELLTAPPEALFPVPPSLTAAEAALLEPLGVAIHALDLARLRPLESVAVLGAGAIGLLLLQVARLAGAGELFVIDPLAYRTELASKLGADRVATDHRAIAEWTHGRGVDVVLEATNSPLGPQHAAEAVRIGGRLILVGIPEGDTFTLGAGLVRRKGLTIKLSRRMNDVYPRAIAMVASGRVALLPLVSHRFGLERTAEALALQSAYRDGVIKCVIELGNG